jgi:serine-type D-Ala-D-Ala carboxypeptidase (penicillin-binding protein 5/6)
MRAGPRVRAVALITAAAVLALVSAPAAVGVPAASGVARQDAPSSTPDAAQRLQVGGAKMASSGIVVNYPTSGKYWKLPKIPASAYVIADANTGQVLAAKDPHGQFPPASTLKVLTAVTLIPKLNPNQMVTATKFAADTEPNDVGLLPHHQYSVANLFRALLLISANDAAVALTQATGSFTRGMEMINAEAHQLQAYDVVAKLPNGLPAKGQETSAYDEALIARQALTIPAFMRYDETLAARFEIKKKKWVTLVNQNYLLTQYQGGIGGKIGWTIKSEATYVGLARRHGVTLIATILHCTPLEEIRAAERLLNWGFVEEGKVKPVGTLVPPLTEVAAEHHAQQAKAQVIRARHRAAHRRAIAVANQAATPNDSVDLGLAAAGLVVIAALAIGGVVRYRRRQADRP